MGHFLEMGGYARYVWPCYALGLAVFVWNIVSARRLHAAGRQRAARAAAQGAPKDGQS
jgi:heme exporter protein CcmD